jgi:hypothetical protein
LICCDAGGSTAGNARKLTLTLLGRVLEATGSGELSADTTRWFSFEDAGMLAAAANIARTVSLRPVWPGLKRLALVSITLLLVCRVRLRSSRM